LKVGDPPKSAHDRACDVILHKKNMSSAPISKIALAACYMALYQE
jgi:hypothetical protein